MSERVEDQVKQMIVERLFLDVDPDSIGDEDNLMQTLGLDSIRLYEISIGLESEFDLDLSEVEYDIENFTTVSKLSALVRKLSE